MKNRPVNFKENKQDFNCAFLASLGMSNNAIKRATNLTDGQITYRLRKGKIKRLDYRNGESPEAKAIIAVAKQRIARTLKHRLPA